MEQDPGLLSILSPSGEVPRGEGIGNPPPMLSLFSSMIPLVCDGGLGSRDKQIDGRRQESSQGPSDEVFNVVGYECGYPYRESYREEMEASPDEGGFAGISVEVFSHAAEG